MGLSVTKAVICDPSGRELGFGESRGLYSTPRPGWVERDMMEIWKDCKVAVRRALKAAEVSGREILAIGVSGHGDGLYLVDERNNPVRPAILSLDSRAEGVVERWERSGVLDAALSLTGKRPFVASPATLISWVREHEPKSLKSARWILSCKDWVKLKLTGEVSTDPTDASASFTDVNTQRYSDEAFRLYDLEGVRDKIPPIVGSTEVGGKLTREAAEMIGLAPGTPVVSGLHDVDSSALGVGIMQPGQLCVVAGTWSVNEVASTGPVLDPRWECRNFVEPGMWLNMAASPTSLVNLEWFVRQLCAADAERAEARGLSPYAFVADEVRAVSNEESQVFYHPFMYGSLETSVASAGFIGLRGWHTRGHLLRALCEGIVFNHKTHVDALRSTFPIHEIWLTGGGTRSELMRQMFADVLGTQVKVANTEESGTRGAALCAGVGADVYRSVSEAVDQVVGVERVYEPDPERHARLTEAYQTYSALIGVLTPLWSDLG